jgi:hypothetical protein
LHDAVAVLVTSGEGDENMEGLRRELGIWHEDSIAYLAIASDDV